MKYIILVPDGMADEPLVQLGGKTPLEAAQTPNMDAMAKVGFSGMVQTIPEGMPPGSDIGNLSLLGYDPAKNFSGRAPLEAANMGIELSDDQIAFRCNLVTLQNSKMIDYSAGHISSLEAGELIGALNNEIGSSDLQFHAGKSYRHLLTIKSSNADDLLKIKSTPPHDILDKNIDDYLPQGKGQDFLHRIMSSAHEVFAKHPVNKARAARQENHATDIWLWGQGNKPNLPFFKTKFGLTGSIISAVDLVNGIGRLAGLDVITVPGATGYYDTDYSAKAQYALRSLEQKDFVYIHVEAPDEAGHNGDYIEKVKAIERIDRDIVGAILKWSIGRDDFRILISPDHPTPVAKRTHTHAPVCFLMAGNGIVSNRCTAYNETTALQAGLKFKSGADMVAYFLSGKSFSPRG